VALTLSYMDGEAALDVRDDGVGFVGIDGSGPNGGLGLHGMRERVEALGGRLAVESPPAPARPSPSRCRWRDGHPAPHRRRPPGGP
jgi:signal transduction histidine kinase